MRCYPEHFTQCCCCCSYLVIPIPGPPIPIPPPAAAPLTGFTCCPGPCEGPPGIIDPIIPADPGSPGCPPPSMLPSFPISVSTQETGGVWRKVLGQIGGVAFLYRYVLCFTYAVKKKKELRRREKKWEKTERSELSAVPPSPPSSSSSSSASAPAGCLLLTWWRERAARPRRLWERENESASGERKRD